MRQCAVYQNAFAVADMPTRIGVAKQLLPGAVEEQTVDERRGRQHRREIGQQELRRRIQSNPIAR